MCYLKSIYWAIITMITTGFGDIVPVSVEFIPVSVESWWKVPGNARQLQT